MVTLFQRLLIRENASIYRRIKRVKNNDLPSEKACKACFKEYTKTFDNQSACEECLRKALNIEECLDYVTG